MLDVLLATLPLSVAAAVSATSFVIFFAILAGQSHQIRNGFAFLVGSFVANSIIALLVVFVSASPPAAHSNPHNLGHAIGDFAIALLALVILGWKFHRNRHPKAAKDSVKPSGMLAYGIYGLVLRSLSANCLPPYLAAIHYAAVAHQLNGHEVLFSSLIINLVSLFPLISAFLLFALFRERALALLKPVSEFLDRNKDRIFYIVLAVVAAYLIAKGFGHLRAS